MPVRSTIRTFTVLPFLPERLQALQKLAYNLWWCWNQEAIALFRRIDPELFESLDSSPVRLLGATPQKRYEELLTDEGFLAHMDRVEGAFDNYMSASAPTVYVPARCTNAGRLASPEKSISDVALPVT